MSPLLLNGNTNQYNINGLLCTYTEMFAYRHAATTFYQLQRGVGGRRQHARIQGFLSVLFSPQLILQFIEGVQWFYCWENYTYTLPKIQRGSIIFQGVGGGSNFFQGGGGVQMLISLETHVRTCYFPGGGGVRTPIPLWIRTWAMSSYWDNIYHSPTSNHNCQALICQD